jgi:hypothetical protein
MGLASISIFREDQVAETLIFPGLAGTPARLHWRVSCFWGFVLRIGANRLTQGFGLFAIRVNAGRSGYRTQRRTDLRLILSTSSM